MPGAVCRHQIKACWDETKPMISRGDSTEDFGDDRPETLMPISVATIGFGTPLKVDLYVQTAPSARPVLYRSADYPADRVEVQRLIDQGIKTVYIKSSQYDAYQEHLHFHLQEFLADPKQPASARMAFLAERAREVLRSAFDSRDASKLVRKAMGISQEIVKLVSASGLVTADMYSMLRHDWCMFAHSFHVAAYTAILAREWGMSDRDTLQSIALAAMLHDIGKLRLPPKVISKADPLNEVEQKLMRQHPQFGFERLCHRDDLKYDQLMVVYQHHERVDGTGYPVGLKGDEIHSWARLTAVTNTFDARTTTRPYQPAISVAEGLESLHKQAGSALDREMVACWTRCMTA
jgi:HD-GYP domain-containing protein (c-di-GMP phosphodiesterase class II)